MKNKKRGDQFCNCISYGRIEPKKLERLQKNRQRQMCTWTDIVPFSERQEEILAASTRAVTTTSKPFFPPIYELPCITNQDTYRAMYNAGNSDLSTDEIQSDNGEESKATSQLVGSGSLPLRNDNTEDDDNGFLNGADSKGCRNSVESQSLRLKLPKLTNVGVVNQRL